MQHLVLNDQTEIPVLGLGTFRLSSDEAEQSVAYALKQGYRLIDTAAVYFNEKAVGRAIKASGIPREEIYLTTKLWPSDFSYKRAVKAIDVSLERLQVDYLDLVLLHQPAGKYMEAWKALEEAVKAGKIRSLGLSNFEGEDLNRILKEGAIKPVLNQVEAHPYHQQTALKKVLAKHHIALEAWYPLASANKELFAEPVFQEAAEKYQKSIVQVILRWHIQAGHLIIPGSKNPAHIDSNADIFDFSLTDDEMAAIAALDRNQQFLKPKKWFLTLLSWVKLNFNRQK